MSSMTAWKEKSLFYYYLITERNLQLYIWFLLYAHSVSALDVSVDKSYTLQLPVHRAVLAAASPVLFELFSRAGDLHHTGAMYKLKHISFQTFKYILDYMYTGRYNPFVFFFFPFCDECHRV